MREYLVGEGIITAANAFGSIVLQEENKSTKGNFSVKIEKISKEIDNCLELLDSKVIVGLEHTAKQVKDRLKDAVLELEKLNNNPSEGTDKISEMIQHNVSNAQNDLCVNFCHIGDIIKKSYKNLSKVDDTKQYFDTAVKTNPDLQNYESSTDKVELSSLLTDLTKITDEIGSELLNISDKFSSFTDTYGANCRKLQIKTKEDIENQFKINIHYMTNHEFKNYIKHYKSSLSPQDLREIHAEIYPKQLERLTDLLNEHEKSSSDCFSSKKFNMKLVNADLNSITKQIDDYISHIKNDLIVPFKNSANQVKDSLKNASLKISEFASKHSDLDLEYITNAIKTTLLNKKQAVLSDLKIITKDIEKGLKDTLKFAECTKSSLDEMSKDVDTSHLKTTADSMIENFKNYDKHVSEFATTHQLLLDTPVQDSCFLG
ncbi:hypothetical protein [Wolbachia endosymbiont of Chironomus riparius]|uniref:hypothetical protein n=1 Tax=Wolbachia endosymbiont of Chironomus riparius TaxID=2883238 RepID=UPI0020A163E8|nr:hypothetical protein [Wolbachia endosymbiont of Chironomus riparius]